MNSAASGAAGPPDPAPGVIPSPDTGGSLSPTLQSEKLRLPGAAWIMYLIGTCLALLIGLAPTPLFFSPIDFPDQILDDAYMYVRYADHELSGAGVCWNRGGPPTYGVTSLGYLLWVTLVRSVTPGDPFRTLVFAGFIPAFFTPIVLLQVAARHIWPTRTLPWALAAAWMVVLHGPLTEHLLLTHGFTGMETTFAVFSLSVAIFALDALTGKPGWRWALLAALTSPLMYLVRPDLLPFPLGIFVARAFTACASVERRQGRRELLLSIGWLALLGAALWAYFGTPVPLSFFAKSGGLYDEGIRTLYAEAGWKELTAFVRKYLVLFIPAVAYTIAVAISPWRRTRSLDVGLILGTALFFTYHLFFVIPIMHYHQRFYMPVLPVVAWLAFRGVESVASAAASGMCEKSRRRWASAGVGAAMVLAAWAVLPASKVAGILPAQLLPRHLGGWDTFLLLRDRVRQGEFARYDVRANYRARWTNYWRRLDAFSALPDDLVIATTEVGHVAALNPHKRIIDLSGLNEARFVFEGFDMNAMIEREKPDLIYLPHPDYASINEALRNSERFRAEYEVYEREQLGSARFGLALRRTSGYVMAMRSLLAAETSGETDARESRGKK